MIKHIPNILTMSRIVMTFFFIYFLARFDLVSMMIATGIFVVAAITDFLDGFIARRYNLMSNLGKILDPLADKFITLAAFVLFAMKELMPWWMVSVIALREVVVTVVRFGLVRQGRVIAAEQSGKIKTVLQMGVILGYLLLLMCMRSPDVMASAGNFMFIFQYALYLLLLLTVFITIGSGIEFFYKNFFKKS